MNNGGDGDLSVDHDGVGISLLQHRVVAMVALAESRDGGGETIMVGEMVVNRREGGERLETGETVVVGGETA